MVHIMTILCGLLCNEPQGDTWLQEDVVYWSCWVNPVSLGTAASHSDNISLELFQCQFEVNIVVI